MLKSAACVAVMSRLRRLFRSKQNFPEDEIQLIEKLEDRLGYIFKDVHLLKRSLSHKSYVNERRLDPLDHNERLEFLGDAVLELGISDLLMRYFPESREGEMSKVRASIVNETALSEVARQLGLGEFLFLGKGEDLCDGRQKNSLLADAVEAILGAIYQESGFERTFEIVRTIFLPLVQKATQEDINRDYKTRLQEEVQTALKLAPQYRLVSESGPDHDKTFEIHLYISGKKVGTGSGKSKKQAEQNAAMDSLEKLPEFLKSLKAS